MQFITQAFALLDTKLDEDPLRQKLLVRMTKAKLHLSSLADAKSLLAKVSPGKEKETLQDAVNRIGTVCSESSAAESESMRRTLLKLPRYKPHLTDEADYFSVSHDVPESQYSKVLQETTKDSEVISFLLFWHMRCSKPVPNHCCLSPTGPQDESEDSFHHPQS